jgi:hypothetical protein
MIGLLNIGLPGVSAVPALAYKQSLLPKERAAISRARRLRSDRRRAGDPMAAMSNAAGSHREVSARQAR